MGLQDQLRRRPALLGRQGLQLLFTILLCRRRWNNVRQLIQAQHFYHRQLAFLQAAKQTDTGYFLQLQQQSGQNPQARAIDLHALLKKETILLVLQLQRIF